MLGPTHVCSFSNFVMVIWKVLKKYSTSNERTSLARTWSPFSYREHGRPSPVENMVARLLSRTWSPVSRTWSPVSCRSMNCFRTQIFFQYFATCYSVWSLHRNIDNSKSSSCKITVLCDCHPFSCINWVCCVYLLN